MPEKKEKQEPLIQYNADGYETIERFDELDIVAAKKNGKWGIIRGFTGMTSEFIYESIGWHYGCLVGFKEDGTMDNYGRYYTH